MKLDRYKMHSIEVVIDKMIVSEAYPAQLDYLSPNVDLNTGTLNIRARLDNPKGLLKSELLYYYMMRILFKGIAEPYMSIGEIMEQV